MSSDEDVPAPSPSASVVARRASREAKSMREESSSDEDTSSNEEWVPAQEQDEEDEEDEGNWGIVDAREESKGGVRDTAFPTSSSSHNYGSGETLQKNLTRSGHLWRTPAERRGPAALR